MKYRGIVSLPVILRSVLETFAEKWLVWICDTILYTHAL